MSILVGQSFPQVPVESVDGPVVLADRWADGPLVIAFHRLWCPFCQEAARQLALHAGEFAAAGAGVVLVYPQDTAAVAETCGQRGTPFDCFGDPGRRLEHAAGVDRMRAGRYLAGASPRRVAQMLRSGARPQLPTGDLLQGRGTYVVGSDGIVTYAHIAQSASDIPPIDDLVAAVRR